MPLFMALLVIHLLRNCTQITTNTCGWDSSVASEPRR